MALNIFLKLLAGHTLYLLTPNPGDRAQGGQGVSKLSECLVTIAFKRVLFHGLGTKPPPDIRFATKAA
jgi:hypothetical protein